MKKGERSMLFQFSIYMLILVLGMFLGMILQQGIMKSAVIEIGYSLSGIISNVEVNINETKIVEGFRESIIPILNQTIQGNKSL